MTNTYNLQSNWLSAQPAYRFIILSIA